MSKNISYHSYLIESLKNPERAEGYLEAALEEKDVKLLQKAVNNVIEAIGDSSDFELLQKAKKILDEDIIQTDNVGQRLRIK